MWKVLSHAHPFLDKAFSVAYNRAACEDTGVYPLDIMNILSVFSHFKKLVVDDSVVVMKSIDGLVDCVRVIGVVSEADYDDVFGLRGQIDNNIQKTKGMQ